MQTKSPIRNGRGRWEDAKVIPIAELALPYRVKLKQGSNRCPFPFHHDAKASFLYNSKQNRFICFGCAQRGSSIDFVAAMLGINAKEAVDEILKRGNQRFPYRAVQKARAAAEPNTTPYKIDPEIYESLLNWCPLKASGKAYLLERGITEKTVHHFSIGQILGGDALLKRLQQKFSQSRLAASGVLAQGRYPKLTLPENSLLFPFKSNNSCVYLQARAIRERANRLRWIGLKGVFKSVYNLAALEEQVVYICEGITDVLSAHELGYNAIGLLGAAQKLPPLLLRDLSDKTIYIIADNDAPGSAMASAVSQQLANSGIASKIQKVPVGKDLNDYLVSLRAKNGK